MNDLGIFQRDSQVLVNSRDVARFFGKRHDHVVRDVDNILKSLQSPDLGSAWFRSTCYQATEDGRTYPAYDLTRQGFVLLTMGYTGLKAMGFKVRYIQEFDLMETELANRQKHIDADFVERRAMELAVEMVQKKGLSHTPGITAKELCIKAGATERGRRGLVVSISARLTNRCAKKGIAIWENEAGTRKFPLQEAEDFMLGKGEKSGEGGNALVRQHNERIFGQGNLFTFRPRRR